MTLLTTAAYNGEEDVVRSLLADGVDPSEADQTGKGPIIYAAGKGSAAIVGLLLDAGADVNKPYAHELTPLMWAAGHADVVPQKNGIATVELLASRGADLNRVDDRGRSALMIAASADMPKSSPGSLRTAPTRRSPTTRERRRSTSPALRLSSPRSGRPRKTDQRPAR